MSVDAFYVYMALCTLTIKPNIIKYVIKTSWNTINHNDTFF